MRFAKPQRSDLIATALDLVLIIIFKPLYFMSGLIQASSPHSRTT